MPQLLFTPATAIVGGERLCKRRDHLLAIFCTDAAQHFRPDAAPHPPIQQGQFGVHGCGRALACRIDQEPDFVQ
jgi:hypothetical protein